MTTLKEFEEVLRRLKPKCRICDRTLPCDISFYPHPDGWTVEGFDTKLWLFVTCPFCDYDWALWKLLWIPREWT